MVLGGHTDENLQILLSVTHLVGLFLRVGGANGVMKDDGWGQYE